MNNQSLKNFAVWCEAHNFPWIIYNDSLYWQTNVTTGELTKEKEFIWHEYNYFNEIKELQL